jgi:polysaccharide deacetylase 2 family uncharacterized protein YibQ
MSPSGNEPAAFADDDLATPLGRGRRRRGRARPIRPAPAIAGVLAACLAVFVLWAAIVDDPYGGEPMVVVAAHVGSGTAANAETVPRPPAARADRPAPADPASGTHTVTIIDGRSGRREDVTLPRESAPPVDERLIERSRHGPIPRVAADGTRPAEAYARSAKAGEGARIALVVTGLGLSAGATREALAKLPAAVTLAFVPYGTDLEQNVAQARGQGHEVLLQVPMEPFDFPEDDAGPQSLLVSLAPEENIDRLHWSMSRFHGYVGIAGYMGSRFTANEQAFTPVLREVARRGLIYFDDARFPRNLARQIAPLVRLPLARADVVLDATPSAATIDAALARLESIARERGVAIGTASMLPLSIARLANWARTAERRGLNLVPLTQVTATGDRKPERSSASAPLSRGRVGG